MRASLLALLLTGCASAPGVPGEYAVPRIDMDGNTWDEIILEPDDTGDRGLFCVQAALSVTCFFGTTDGTTYTFAYPLIDTDQFLEPEGP